MLKQTLKPGVAMPPNEKLINTFYSCFKQLDGNGMAACYHENICFSDPVFPIFKRNNNTKKLPINIKYPALEE